MKKTISNAIYLLLFLLLFNVACKKTIQQTRVQDEIASIPGNENLHGHLKQTKTFSSDVVISWLNMQLSMLKIPLPPGTGSQPSDRCMAYCGIALYEAVVPGMPAYQSLSGQLTGFPEMPNTEPGKAYHWAASANAALAEMNRRLFPTTAAVNIINLNNLETTLQATYATEVDASILQRSVAFGKEIASRVFTWAVTDGFANVNPPYIPPVGPGLWVPTAATPPINPYAYQRRLLVPGVRTGTAPEPLPPFSTNPASPFYAMVKEVYDISFITTPDQKAMADYFKDNPGYGPGGGFISLFSQALNIAHPMLDRAALTYVKAGLALHDATIILFIDKYNFNTIRPITYIRAHINPTWNTYINTPNHPEFPSGHATTNGAVLTMFSNMFGENFPITLHTYDYLGYPPRSYTTFTAIGTDMANSRLYGGLHYRETCDKSLVQGKKVAQNILNTINFLK
jgi:membrane-associated phospholipid phosphatase